MSKIWILERSKTSPSHQIVALVFQMGKTESDHIADRGVIDRLSSPPSCLTALWRNSCGSNSLGSFTSLCKREWLSWLELSMHVSWR